LQGQLRDLQLKETIASKDVKRTETQTKSLKDIAAIYKPDAIDDFLNS
jgi:hypothetical protein